MSKNIQEIGQNIYDSMRNFLISKLEVITILYIDKLNIYENFHEPDKVKLDTKILYPIIQTVYKGEYTTPDLKSILTKLNDDDSDDDSDDYSDAINYMNIIASKIQYSFHDYIEQIVNICINNLPENYNDSLLENLVKEKVLTNQLINGGKRKSKKAKKSKKSQKNKKAKKSRKKNTKKRNRKTRRR